MKNSPLQFDYCDTSGDYVAEYRGLTIKAVHDSDCESPREWSNVAIMACAHRRYNLGDSDGMLEARHAIRDSRFYRDTWEESESGEFTFKGVKRDCFDLSDPSDLWEAMQLCTDIECQPLYLYDHSGITISTGRFSCPWDSGQVGFAFVTLERLKAESYFKRWTPAARQWARDRINGETEVYDHYLTGQVYGFVLASDSDDHMDSVWGFYGTDFEESGLSEAARDAADHLIETAQKKRLACLARLIRNRVPLDKRAAMLASEGSL